MPRRSRSGFGKVIVTLLLAGFLVVAGGIATMYFVGFDFQRLAFWESDEPEAPTIGLPINPGALVAYERIRREDLLDPQTGQLSTIKLPLNSVRGMRVEMVGDEEPSAVESVDSSEDGLVFNLRNGQTVGVNQVKTLGGAFLHATDIVGRVLRRDKPSGLAFSEAAFFDSGTPAGLAGATPPGMRALTLEADRLTGVHRVSQGENIDLVANVPLDRLQRFELATSSRLPGSQLVVDGNQSARDAERETTARLVASQARVLTSVAQRVATESTSSLSQGRRILAVPIEEVVLAVAAEDVAAVTAALELGATINVLVRTGRPEATASDRRPAPEGTIPVPIPGKPLLAYQSIDANVFEEAATGYIRYAYLSKESVEAAGWITDLNEFIGRIPSLDLPVGQPIPESSLMPVGTKTGLVGATPKNRVLFFLDRETLVGADAFGFSQRLDIVASVTREPDSGGSATRSSDLTLTQRTRVEPIADDVVVIMPTRSRANPTLAEGDAGQLILAVRPDQVGQLQFAVATDARLRATVRPATNDSDLLGDATTEDQPIDVTSMSFDPLENAKVTQMFINGERQRVMYFPEEEK